MQIGKIGRGKDAGSFARKNKVFKSPIRFPDLIKSQSIDLMPLGAKKLIALTKSVTSNGASGMGVIGNQRK